MRALCLALLLTSFVRAEDKPADPRRLRPDHAPTPYTADQIREGCPAGRTSTFRLEKPGHLAQLQTFRFVRADEKGAVLEVVDTTPDGKEKTRSPAHSTWGEFQSHASFPEKMTRIEKGKVETAAGVFDCLIYVVTGKTKVSRFHFAKDLPGPPVKLTQRQDGKLVFAMTLVKHRDGDEAKLLKAMGGDAKAAFEKMGGADVTLEGFVARSGIADKKVATRAFRRFDRNADGNVSLKEFLAVWNDWGT